MIEESIEKVPYTKPVKFFKKCSEIYPNQTTKTKIGMCVLIDKLKYYLMYYMNGLNGKIQPCFGPKI